METKLVENLEQKQKTGSKDTIKQKKIVNYTQQIHNGK